MEKFVPFELSVKLRDKGLRNAVKKTEEKLNEASCAVQSIEQYLTFCGFGEIKPQISACNGDEIILYYYGEEMYIEDAIERMESVGYISRDDF